MSKSGLACESGSINQRQMISTLIERSAPRFCMLGRVLWIRIPNCYIILGRSYVVICQCYLVVMGFKTTVNIQNR